MSKKKRKRKDRERFEAIGRAPSTYALLVQLEASEAEIAELKVRLRDALNEVASLMILIKAERAELAYGQPAPGLFLAPKRRPC